MTANHASVAPQGRRPTPTPAPGDGPALSRDRPARQHPGAALRRSGAAPECSPSRPALAAALTIALLLGACAGDPVEPASQAAPVRILREEPQAATTGEARGAATLPSGGESEVLEGRIVEPGELVVGECFNTYLTSLGSDELRELTTVVDCDSAHDGEVYFQVYHPGAAEQEYPGTQVLATWGERQCYLHFAPFVGQEYELSDLEVGVINPSAETWSDPWGRGRQVTCYLTAWRGGRLLGSMRLSGF